MSESKNIYILGYSGHAYVTIDIALEKGCLIKGYFDFEQAVSNPYDLNYCGDEQKIDLKEKVGADCVFPGIGSNTIRKKLVHLIRKNEINEITLIAATALISNNAKVGSSTLVGNRATVNSSVMIGSGCIINTAAIIEHECTVGDFTHIAPAAVLCGNVHVGQEVFIGANSVIKQGVNIGDNVTVGAGSVVLKDISKGEVWAGNPAKRIR